MLRTILASTLLCSFATVANAQDTIAIPVSDVDFSNTQEVASVHAQIVEAADDLCGNEVDYLYASLRGTRARRADCISSSVDVAVSNADIDTLTSFHQAQLAQ